MWAYVYIYMYVYIYIYMYIYIYLYIYVYMYIYIYVYIYISMRILYTGTNITYITTGSLVSFIQTFIQSIPALILSKRNYYRISQSGDPSARAKLGAADVHVVSCGSQKPLARSFMHRTISISHFCKSQTFLQTIVFLLSFSFFFEIPPPGTARPYWYHVCSMSPEASNFLYTHPLHIHHKQIIIFWDTSDPWKIGHRKKRKKVKL